jgi:hypothetical protein
MRLNSSVILLGFPVAMACPCVSATELHDLPRCLDGIKIIHSQLAPLQFTIRPVGEFATR